MISIQQIRAARAMLHLSQKEVAARADISIATYNNIERGAQENPHLHTMHAIQQAFENEGIEFINEPFIGEGVKLKKRIFKEDEAVVLIVDDSESDRRLYIEWLRRMPGKKYHIIEAVNAHDGFEKFLKYQPDCVILDFMMYGADGFQLLTKIKQEALPLPPIIFVTGVHNDLVEENAKSEGVFCYLNKQKMASPDLCGAVGSSLRMRA